MRQVVQQGFVAWGISVLVTGLYGAGAMLAESAGAPELLTEMWWVYGVFLGAIVAPFIYLAGHHRLDWRCWFGEEV